MPPDMFMIPEDSAVYAMSVALENHLQADLTCKCLVTACDRCIACKQLCKMKEVEWVNEKVEDEDEDEWQQRNPKSDDESDGQLEWLDGPKNNRNLTVVPNYLTQNKKKLMAGTRRHIPAKI
jgi:hypothetical protein